MLKPTLFKLLACSLLAPTAALAGDSIVLSGVVYDFRENHADMQRPSVAPGAVYEGMVLPVLGADGKPQLNVGEINCHFDQLKNKVTVISAAHEISNVVLQYDDGTTYKYDDQTGHSHTYGNHTPGKIIVGCWVKAGANKSYDGSGYGTYFSPGDVETYEYVPEEWRVESSDSFNQWFRSVPGVNIVIPHEIELKETEDGSGIYQFARDQQMPVPYKYFFPIDGLGWNDDKSVSTGTHNFYFTYEIKSEFTYTDPSTRSDKLYFTFTGDDDVWVFVNGRLAVDIGGCHAQASRSVVIDDLDPDEFGITPGETYRLDIFFAERAVTESNFRIRTNIPLTDVPTDLVSPLYD